MSRTRKRSKAFAIFVGLFASSWFLFAQESHEIENVAAFARLYGVALLLSSDTPQVSTGIDSRLTAHARVRTASDSAALELRLRGLVADLGPGIESDGR
jgi:hypothetical protein